MELFTRLFPIGMCFLAGVCLLVLEALTPGFGIAGISGILLQACTVYLVWSAFGMGPAIIVAIVMIAIIAFAITMALRSVTKGRLSKSRIILHETESSENGFSASSDLSAFVGREGVTTTALRPSGIAEFDGVRLDVLTDGEFIAAGTPVRIQRIDGARVLVRPIQNTEEV